MESEKYRAVKGRKSMRKERKSNLELLRITAMLLIVANHYAGWIVPAFAAERISVN